MGCCLRMQQDRVNGKGPLQSQETGLHLLQQICRNTAMLCSMRSVNAGTHTTAVAQSAGAQQTLHAAPIMMPVQAKSM